MSVPDPDRERSPSEALFARAAEASHHDISKLALNLLPLTNDSKTNVPKTYRPEAQHFDTTVAAKSQVSQPSRFRIIMHRTYELRSCI